MDRRQKKTRKAIFTAFEELLGEKRYDQITVQDIIDRADVGRTTFYAHFETKDSLLDAICQELFAHIFDKQLAAEEDHNFSRGDHAARERLTHILYHLNTDRKRYKKLFSGESADIFWTYFGNWFRVEMQEDIRKELQKKQNSLPDDFYMNFYVNTFIGTVRWWFGQDCKVSPEKLEGYFEEVVL